MTPSRQIIIGDRESCSTSNKTITFAVADEMKCIFSQRNCPVASWATRQTSARQRLAMATMVRRFCRISTTGTINHRVEILTLDGFMRDYMGIGAEQELGAADWLSLPQHKLLSFTSGAVFHDELDIQRVRDRYSYFPQDLWLYLLACAWSRIGQDEHLAPRAGAIGDELGSSVIAGRLARSIILLCFLYERRYAPYPKWLGTAFAGLRCARGTCSDLAFAADRRDLARQGAAPVLGIRSSQSACIFRKQLDQTSSARRARLSWPRLPGKQCLALY